MVKHGKFTKTCRSQSRGYDNIRFCKSCMKTQMQDTSGSQTTSGKETLASGPSNATGEQTVVGH